MVSSRALRVLVAPDKFKGTLTAREAAEAIRTGWCSVRPQDTLTLVPMSDGGDGFGELLGLHLRAKRRYVRTVDAAHRPIRASWWWVAEERLAIIESASVVGLALLPPKRFHPFTLDTYGLGRVVRAAYRMRPNRCLLGIGGSATNDGGFGLARAMGWRFLNASGQKIEQWTQLDRLTRVEPLRSGLRLKRLEIAVDVRNPLLGIRGATRVYGPQKGLTVRDAPEAERCLRRLAKVLAEYAPIHRSAHKAHGAGAAGGLGYGLKVFLGAELVPGFELFANHAGLKERLSATDLVITGEGRIDRTTALMGKGVGELARLCRGSKLPCLGLAGSVEPGARRYFTDLQGMVPGVASKKTAMAEAGRCLVALARQAAGQLDRPSRARLYGCAER